jgi:hypothetical protein
MKLTRLKTSKKQSRFKIFLCLNCFKFPPVSLVYYFVYSVQFQLYTDCLCALDFSGSEAQSKILKNSIQIPVTTNLAACMLEQGQ